MSFINGYLYFRCFEKVLGEERYENKKEKVEVLQLTIYSRKETRKQKVCMMKFLALTLYLVVRIALTLISTPVIIGCFQKINFEGFNLVI